MDQFDEPYYFMRNSTSQHESFIRDRLTKPAREYERILHTVFEHQPAVFGDYKPDAEGRPAGRLNLAKYFYEKCYVKPKIARGYDGIDVALQDFIQDVFLRPSDDYRNSISYLLGDVGIGKTSMVSFLITTYGRSWVDDYKGWFARIDCEGAGLHRDPTVSKFLNAIVVKTCRILTHNSHLVEDSKEVFDKANMLKTLVSPSDFFENADSKAILDLFQRQLYAFSGFVKAMKERLKRNFILIIDNLDFVCHLNDRGLFMHNDNTSETDSLSGICQLAHLFFHGNTLLGNLASHVLLVMRKHSYRLLSTAGKTSLPAVEARNIYAFTLKPPDWNAVLDARSALVSYAATSVKAEGKRKQFLEVTKRIRTHLDYAPEKEPKLVEHLKNLTNYGLMEMMNYFAQYSWIPHREGEGEATTRFMTHYPVGLITYLLGGMRRFHQFISKFPNIYIVLRLSAQDKPFSAEHEHRHTYWLKRLIMEYLNSLDNETVTVRRVMNVFCPRGGKGYNDTLIRECLGSLADANCSNAVTAERNVVDDNITISSVSLTLRGKHCLESIFDRFFYLQLMVDDFLLPLPRLKKADNGFSMEAVFKFPQIDYSYVLLDDRQYYEIGKAMIRIKAHQVMYFLEVLRVALEQEKRIYSDVFERFQGDGVVVPNVDRIIEGVYQEFEALNKWKEGLIRIERLKQEVRLNRAVIQEFVKRAYTESEDKRHKAGQAQKE